MITTLNSDMQYHVKVAKGQVGKYCILPGDPGRCEKIAAYLDDARLVSYNREYCVWNGTLLGETVTVCSTGIGGPSTAIAVEELAACGGEVMIRVGTCGGISMSVKSGDVVISSGAVRQDGTSLEYAPVIFPAVADYEVLDALVRAARESNHDYHVGVVQSKDSFYGQHSPARMPTAGDLAEKWEAWKRLGVLASEMEASTLYTVAAALGIKAGSVFLAVWNQERINAGLDNPSDKHTDTDCAIKVAIEAIKKMISENKQ